MQFLIGLAITNFIRVLGNFPQLFSLGKEFNKTLLRGQKQLRNLRTLQKFCFLGEINLKETKCCWRPGNVFVTRSFWQLYQVFSTSTSYFMLCRLGWNIFEKILLQIVFLKFLTCLFDLKVSQIGKKNCRWTEKNKFKKLQGNFSLLKIYG